MLYQVKFGGQIIEYTVRRRNRKTVGILVDPVRGVIISAHPRVEVSQLQMIVLKRAGWIIEKQNQLKNTLSQRIKKKFVEGECFWYLGKEYPLSIKTLSIQKDDQFFPMVNFLGNSFQVLLSTATVSEKERASLIRSAFLRWYFARAEETILRRINIYKKEVIVNPLTIRIRQQKCCWGSCTGKNALHFNWRLVLSPIAVIDYVVVHELCHLRIKNHSPRFWSLVGSVIPDYQDQKTWLRRNGIHLDL